MAGARNGSAVRNRGDSMAATSPLPRARWGLSHHRGRPGLPPRARPHRGAALSLTDPSHEAPHEPDAQGRAALRRYRMRFLTRKGFLIEEQGMSYLADTDPDRGLWVPAGGGLHLPDRARATCGAQGAELANRPDTRAACPRALCPNRLIANRYPIPRGSAPRADSPLRPALPCHTKTPRNLAPRANK
jgi:hypothetical protein